MRAKTHYQCQSCGAATPKWAGQCPDCSGWNTLVETLGSTAKAGRGARGDAPASANRPHALAEVEVGAEARLATGMAEMDRVLGGGLVAGSVVLLGGDPGIGKSTLLLQLVASIAGARGAKALYVSGEESLRQIALRARRMEVEVGMLRVLAETSVEHILDLAVKEHPGVMVIDSIQTTQSGELSSAPGSVSQVRECAAQFVRHAKMSGAATFLVGHVTKDGALAGPRVLEHMVDTVLYFEGDSGTRFRVLRAFKNRFGAVNELGVFAMTDRGLREVANPSAIFLSRHDEEVPGSVVMITREGTRPLLVEVQALVDEAQLANPRRVTVGLDPNRLAMLLAVLHRHGGVATQGQDVFVNVVGGVRISETGADLAVVLAVLSSLRNRPLPKDLVVFGELGLAGEVRPVQGGQERLREAGKHGFRRAIVPAGNAPRSADGAIEVLAVTRLSDAIEAARAACRA